MTDLPTVITSAGLQVTSPSVLRANTVTYAQAESPGVTTDLPGTLIEDMTSTSTGALVQIDQARVDSVNSITPYGCNVALLNQMGEIYGVTRGSATNTSCYVQFSGTPGYVINVGTIVSDGTYQYSTQDMAVIGSDGSSGNVYVVATVGGAWAIPVGSITTMITSVPTGYGLTVTNAATGTPGSDAESDSSYRYRMIQSGACSAQSMPRFVKSLIRNVPGVNSRLVSISTVTGGYRILVGGGDPYQVAGAIYQGCFDLYALNGSVNTITAISQSASATITTELTHGLSSGATVDISGCEGMVSANGTWSNIVVVNNNSFRIPLNSTSLPAYTGSGSLDTNPRNEVVSIIDSPDSYSIPFVIPLQETVSVNLVWNTTATNVISSDTASSLGASAIASYINSIEAGAPINLYAMQQAFVNSISSVVSADSVSRMVFTVYIGGEEVSEDSGTGLIRGDSQSYLYTTSSSINITRG